MQLTIAMVATGVLLTATLPSAVAHAESSRPIGHTGQRLRNRPDDQPKHYVMHEHALLQRVAVLLRDTDHTLRRLHALEPELALTDPVREPVDAELASLFEIALRCNPSLRPPRSELAVLAARTRQAGADYDPMASFAIMQLRTPFGPLTGTQGLGARLGLRKEFASYGKRGLREELAAYAEPLKELELAQMELELLLAVTDEYYDLFGMRARLRAIDQNFELMEVLVELAERRLSIGATPQASVLSAQVQLSQMELMRIELRRGIEQSQERLYGLLGRPAEFDITGLRFDAPYLLPPATDWHVGELVNEALNRYPPYQQALLASERQDLAIELARREYHPNYMLMGEYEVGIGMQDRVMLGIEVPLFVNKESRQDAVVQEERAEQAVALDRAAAIASDYTTRVRELQFELAMHGELVDLYRLGSLPQARLAFESNIGGYSAGLLDFADLVMAQQALLNQELELEQNHIHVLHTLTDLHVLTLGAFDPAPYLIPATLEVQATGEPVVVAPLPDDVPAAAPHDAVEELQEPESNAGLQVPDLAETDASDDSDVFYRPYEPREDNDG